MDILDSFFSASVLKELNNPNWLNNWKGSPRADILPGCVYLYYVNSDSESEKYKFGFTYYRDSNHSEVLQYEVVLVSRHGWLWREYLKFELFEFLANRGPSRRELFRKFDDLMKGIENKSIGRGLLKIDSRHSDRQFRLSGETGYPLVYKLAENLANKGNGSLRLYKPQIIQAPRVLRPPPMRQTK